MALLSFGDHALNADESLHRETRQQGGNQHVPGVTHLQEILEFVRELMQAGAVIRDGLPCFLKFFA